MNGIETARRAREERPDLPVLFATGYGETVPFADHDIDRNSIVCKPYRRSELLRKIQACIGAGSLS